MLFECACVSMCEHSSEAKESVFFVSEHGTGPKRVQPLCEHSGEAREIRIFCGCGLGVILSPQFVLS